MASWDVDELESQLLFREEDKDGIETEIRRITGNRNIELLENERKDGLVAGRLEADGERWPCGDVGPMDIRGMVRIASLFEQRSVLGFCDSYSDFYRLETRADGKVLAKRLSAGDAYETLRWEGAPFTKQYLFDDALADALSTADLDPWREIYPEGHAEPCRLDPASLGVDGWALEEWLEDVGSTTETGTAGVSVSVALADGD